MKRASIPQKERHKYDLILYLPHHVSAVHPPIPDAARAAQFAPFSALAGHDAAVRETARLTSRKVELDEDMKEQINRKLQILQKRIAGQPWVKVTYFVPDDKKKGGDYQQISGCLKKIEMYTRKLIFTDGREVPIDCLGGIEIQGHPIP